MGREPLAIHARGKRAGGQAGPQDTVLALIRKQSGPNAASISFQILRYLKPMHALSYLELL